MATTYNFKRSELPLLVSIPHAGIELSPGLLSRLSECARDLPDTDWYVDRLYRKAIEWGAGIISARYSRYVIDLNRPPDNASLYPGKTTGLVPLETFSGDALYQGDLPGKGEIRDRIENYYLPYHQALAKELQRLKEKFGYAMLLDSHSIRSHVPMLFEGRLPDLNLGSFDGKSANGGLVENIEKVFSAQSAFSYVTNGRFKGGHITRHYGQPEHGIHALQLEMAQSAYMMESPPHWNSARAARIRPLLSSLLESMLDWGAKHD